MFENAVNLMGFRQQTFTVAAGVTANPLAPGVYDVWADGDVYLDVAKVKADATSPTASTGYLLRLGQTIPVQITEAAFLGAGGGTATNVYFHQVK